MTIKYYTREQVDDNTQEQVESMLDKFGLIMWETNYEEVAEHHPKWVKYCVPRDGEQHYQCTKCKEYFNFGQYGDYYTKAFKYCPNCGSRMEA